MKLNSIQCLRAIAVISVVYMHSIDLQAQYAISWQQNFFHLHHIGGIGVDLFFVISGFIISFVAYKYIGIEQGVHFLTKRFTRINPVYYLATLFFLLILLLFWWTTNLFPKHHVIDQIIRPLFNTLIIFPVSGDTQLYSHLLGVGWTLSFEWLFYSLFFILIYLRIQRKLLILSFVLLPLAILGALTRPPYLQIAFITNPIILEFLLGATIYWIYNRRKPNLHYISPALISMGLISYTLLIAYGYGDIWGSGIFYMPGLGLKRFLIWGLPSSCIVAGCIFWESNNKLTSIWKNPLLQLIGDASYSIYLTHMSTFLLMRLLYTKTGYFLPPDIGIHVQLAVAIIIGIVFYKKVETPLLRLINHNNSKTTNKKPAGEYSQKAGVV